MNASVGHLGLPLDVILIFASVVAVSVWMDLRLHKSHKEISMANAAIWSVVWIALGCSFGVFIRFRFGPEYASAYFSGYALEKALSIDNLMVFIAIFFYFNISGPLQHRILYYGILGALVFRAMFVVGGTALLALGPGVELIFGLIVFVSAIQLLRGGDEDGNLEDYSDHKVVRFLRRFFPVFHRLDGPRFFVSAERAREILAEHPPVEPLNRPVSKVKRWITPALICLAVVEISDVMFSFDSVPAVIAVTREPVLVYSAMIFAILGLRSLYFVLAALTRSLVHLDKAVFFLLFFIGGKLWLTASDQIWHWFATWKPSSQLWTWLPMIPGGDRSLDSVAVFLGATVSYVLIGGTVLVAAGMFLAQILWRLTSVATANVPPPLPGMWRTTAIGVAKWLALRAPLVGLAEYLTLVIRNADDVHVAPAWNMAIVLGILAAGVAASLIFPGKPDEAAAVPTVELPDGPTLAKADGIERGTARAE